MTPSPPLPLCALGHVQPEPGGRFCVACGGALLPPAGPDAPGCALHPHLRASQACPRCGNFACQACLRTAPGGGVLCATCDGRVQELPWDQRAQVGTLRAFVRTCWSIMFHPVRTLDRTRPEGGIGSSLWFAVLAEAATYLTTLLLYSALVAALLIGFATRGEGEPSGLTPLTSAGIGAGIVAAMGGVFLVSALGVTLLSSALDHLVLKLVGANPRSFEVTLRAHALSLAPALVGLVPVCGLYVIPIWSLVIRVFAYKALHRIGGGQAAAGALVVPGALIFVTLLLYMVALIVAGVAGTA